MNRKGVCYDTGRVMMGQNWRPLFDPGEVRREMEIIRSDLYCNAIRICGEEIERLTMAGAYALEQGLEVWLSPELWDKTPEETLDYIKKAAEAAEKLRRRNPDRVVFSLGSELTLFMQDIVAGKSVLERLRDPANWELLRTGAHNAPLNSFLARANQATRRVFRGAVTYASIPFERVDWTRFDIVSTDLYRDARFRDQFTGVIRRFLAYEKPVVVTETGCCTYRGAAHAGGHGWEIVDYEKMPPQLKRDYVRDEGEQARELIEVLSLFDEQGVDGVFVMTFIAPLCPFSENPKFDLDMASYSLVKSYGSRLGAPGAWGLKAEGPDSPWDARRLGTVYSGMPWDPKESFRAVGEYYKARLPGTPR